MAWLPNITVCEVGGHTFNKTTSTGKEFQCIVHDVCKQPMLSHNVRLPPPLWHPRTRAPRAL